MKIITSLSVFFLCCILLLTACTQPPAETPEAEPVEPAPATALPDPTPTASLPEPTPAQILISDPAQLVGTWVTRVEGENWYARFNADGTCQQAYTIEALDSAPNVECTYQMDGTNLTYTDVALYQVPACETTTAIFQVEAQSADRIRFITVEDACQPRSDHMALVYTRVP